MPPFVDKFRLLSFNPLLGNVQAFDSRRQSVPDGSHRNPRSVAIKEHIIGNQHCLDAANHWHESVVNVLDFLHRYGIHLESNSWRCSLGGLELKFASRIVGV